MSIGIEMNWRLMHGVDGLDPLTPFDLGLSWGWGWFLLHWSTPADCWTPLHSTLHIAVLASAVQEKKEKRIFNKRESEILVVRASDNTLYYCILGTSCSQWLSWGIVPSSICTEQSRATSTTWSVQGSFSSSGMESLQLSSLSCWRPRVSTKNPILLLWNNFIKKNFCETAAHHLPEKKYLWYKSEIDFLKEKTYKKSSSPETCDVFNSTSILPNCLFSLHSEYNFKNNIEYN